MLAEIKPVTPKRTKPGNIRPPRTLSAGAKRIWSMIEREWSLDNGARLCLATALKNFDLGEQAAEILRREGLILEGKPNPAIKILKDADLLLLRAWRSIGLDVEPPRHEIGRPEGS